MAVVYRKNPDVVFRTIADEFILVPIRQKAVDLKSVFTLNETGAFIWGLIDGTMTDRGIEEALAREFSVDPVQARRDAGALLGQLEAAGLISRT